MCFLSRRKAVFYCWTGRRQSAEVMLKSAAVGRLHTPHRGSQGAGGGFQQLLHRQTALGVDMPRH